MTSNSIQTYYLFKVFTLIVFKVNLKVPIVLTQEEGEGKGGGTEVVDGVAYNFRLHGLKRKAVFNGAFISILRSPGPELLLD